MVSKHLHVQIKTRLSIRDGKRHVQKKMAEVSIPGANVNLLLRVLNDEAGEIPEDGREIVNRETLISLVKQFQKLESARLVPGNESAANTDFATINRTLRGFLATPKIVPHCFYDPDTTSRGWELRWGLSRTLQPFFELNQVLSVIAIAKSDRISSLRQCDHCRRWLFARFVHARFCAKECRELFHQNDEVDKVRRRDWARKNYSLHKNKNTK